MKASDFASRARLALTALLYFTRIPIAAREPFSQERLDRAMVYFPAVGVLIGAALAVLLVALEHIWPPAVAIAVVLACSALLTGGLHEDGLADFCDAFLTQRDREGVLAIMKDPRIGAYGALALIFSTLIRYAALLSLPLHWTPLALIAGCAYSRFLAFAAMQCLDYVRVESARIKPGRSALTLEGVFIAGVAGILPLAGLGAHAFICALAPAVVAIVLGRICKRRIGGYTGDCLGAIQQLTELALYLALLAV